jgi:hypothetical protein
MARYIKAGTPTTIGEVDSNLEAIEVALADMLSRKGDAPNQMDASLDMNSQRILNLPPPASDNEPARLIDLDISGQVDGLLAVKEEIVPITTDVLQYTFPTVRQLAGSAFYMRDAGGDLGTRLVEGYDYVLREDIDLYTLDLTRSWNNGNLLQRVYNSFAGGDRDVPVKSGVGDPEGVVSAVVGTIYSRTDGLPNQTLYIKESGSGTTGWVAQGSFDGSVQEETLAISGGVVLYTFPAARALDGSAFFMREPLGDLGAKLVQGVDYNLRPDINAYTLELTRTWDAGNILQRVYNAFAGATAFSSSSNKPVMANVAELEAAVTFDTGYVVTIPDRGNAKYILRDNTYTALSGDVTRVDGKIWELQPTDESEWNVLWFGATSDKTGTIIATTFFDAAATRAGTNGVVIVPEGGFKIDAPIGQAVTWKIQPATEIYGIGGVSPTFERDLTRLTGSVLKLGTTSSWNTLRVGDPTYTVQKLTKKAFSAEIEGHSDDAAGGVLGTTYASARSTVDASRHSLTGIAVNDSNDLTGVWSAYLEAYILPSTNGNSFCLESTSFNANSTINVIDTPNTTVAGRQGLTYNMWLTTGGDPAFGEPMYDTTAAIGILGKEGVWGAKYDKGIVCKNDSIASSDFCAIPTGLQYSWWEDKGSGDIKRAFIEGVAPSTNGQITLAVYNGSGYKGVIVTPGQVSASDNDLNLGAADRRWKEVFSVNGTINTSDEREKTFEEITATEKLVALDLKAAMKKFKWDSSVERETAGGSKARIHFGVGAQTVISIFASHGLDATDYSLLCYDEWDAQAEVLNNSGEVSVPARVAGNRYGVRYTELLAFIIGAM